LRDIVGVFGEYPFALVCTVAEVQLDRFVVADIMPVFL